MELAAIRDRKLYKADFGTFEEYVEQRWEWERTRAYRLINAAILARDSLLPIGNIPARESHIRPLLEQRWEWEPRHAYRLMDAARLAEKVLCPMGQIPQRERHIRPLLERLESDTERADVGLAGGNVTNWGRFAVVRPAPLSADRNRSRKSVRNVETAGPYDGTDVGTFLDSPLSC